MSDSLTEDDLAPWTDTTTIVRRADAHRAVAELKDQPGKDILMFGSRTLWNDLLVAGLVDLEAISLLRTYGEARALALRDVWIPGLDDDDEEHPDDDSYDPRETAEFLSGVWPGRAGTSALDGWPEHLDDVGEEILAQSPYWPKSVAV